VGAVLSRVLVCFFVAAIALHPAHAQDTGTFGITTVNPPGFDFHLLDRLSGDGTLATGQCNEIAAALPDYGPWIVRQPNFQFSMAFGQPCAGLAGLLVQVPSVDFYCNPNAICGGDPTEPIFIPIFRGGGGNGSVNGYSGGAPRAPSNIAYSYPYVVALAETKDTVTCTGTIIGQSAILTAAHCICKGTQNHSLNWAFIGNSIISGDPLSKGESAWIDISGATSEFFQWSCSSSDDDLRRDYDVVVLRLRYELGVNPEFIATIPELAFYEMLRHEPGEAYAVGFGASEYSTRGGSKRHAVIQPWMCAENPTYPRDCNGPHEFRASDQESHIDTCLGDSGGPVMRFYQGLRVVYGVTSRGFGNEVCGSGGIYVGIFGDRDTNQGLAFHAWLRRFI